jgi:hypothetical protein
MFMVDFLIFLPLYIYIYIYISVIFLSWVVIVPTSWPASHVLEIRWLPSAAVQGFCSAPEIAAW